ncbi:NAD(P)-binding protein [Aspergillus steynii IBT 23096]|uniref:NAD(P)-binding protein n=1 Tax=Aspergillus steynii IBT 23096 TaxID=1392250 RepID=A0A2I2GEI5_9EURO|nr:NAD(P)-binding protein [Aspergillus steynii IBT 23096]PLB51293.1 NAD(P)-binding protein [Aspergillus steynii IBT 23096]
MRLDKKVAIVTGSSSGIGRAIAIRYANEGAFLVCADLSPTARSDAPEELEITTHEAIQRGGGRAIFVTTDVSNAQAVEQMVQAAVKEFGRLDILVNNAGVVIESRRPGKVHETDEEAWDKTMLVNAKSVFLGCKYGTAQMLKQEPHESGDRGWIINMSSILGIVGAMITPSYCASKGAISNLTRQVALDYAADRIHANAICPGFTRTAILRGADDNLLDWEGLEKQHPLKGLGVPDDIARMAVVLASEDASWMTGACVPVDGGYTAM